MRRLLIRPGAIGDCILCFPALEWLRADYTEVWISTPLVPLVTFADTVHSLSSTGIDLVGVGDIPTPEPFAARIRSFDSVVSWYGANRPDFQEALTSFGTPCQFLSALPPESYERTACDYFAAQVGAPPGLLPKVRLSAASPRHTAVIHPFSGSGRKNWPLHLFQELATNLPVPVEWTAGPEEVLEGATRFTDLADLGRWIKGAELYIGNDSGITHLAAALRVRTLAIFAPASPRMWEPRGEHVRVLRCDSLEDLSVESVLSAI